ncbi:MAG: class I tRNA ligase family protein, partial [Myxococcota bacterium]
CVACEAFYTEGQLEPGNLCPIHKREVSWVSEPSYFFRMSKYAEPLLAHFEAHPDFVRPENYRNEIISFIKGGLRDLSVSRTSFSWGISVPGDSRHVIYVWIDALTNYISALGGEGGSLYQRYWPATCHLIGKDILRFHAVYWPCMLMSAGLPLPKTIFTTGFWTVRGTKISKSMPATRIEPTVLADDIGVDALRYFLLREVPLGLDGDFSYDALLGRYNADLANDLGNLLNRTLTMTGKFCDGKVPARSSDLVDVAHHGVLARAARESMTQAAKHFENVALSRALESIWSLVREANRYIDACQPWKLAKQIKADPQAEGVAAVRVELDHAMRCALEALLCAARMAAPVMPHKAAELLGQLGLEGEDRAEVLGSWPEPDSFGLQLQAGLTVQRGEVLFPRIDKERQAELM